MAAFRLSKWYLDCVTDSGDVFIGYTGVVEWGRLRLHYSSVLRGHDGRTAVCTSLVPQDEPAWNGEALVWSPPAFAVCGEWRRDAAPISQTVLASDNGSIEWRCDAPRALVCIDGSEGFGYAEHLTMTIPPWRLPLRTLRWGRFVCESESVVWIDWIGEVCSRTVFWNGMRVETTCVADERIDFADGSCLSMDRAFVLRDGPIGKTALSAIPAVNRTFPVRLLQVKECKWRSRALLTRPGQNPVEAWVIHERVDWPD